MGRAGAPATTPDTGTAERAATMAIGSTIPFTAIPWDDILFVALAGTLLASGLAVVLMRDIIRCGLAMMVCFGALAGLYVLAGAPVVAAAEVLVYIGAISVLVLFAIMLTQTKSAPSRLAFQTQAGAAAVAAVVLLVVLLLAVGSTAWLGGPERGDTKTADVATALFTTFVLPFEVVGVLLLAAVIGGVFLAKRDRSPTDRPE
jgi:NADH-quinone oxidoreductase subunit J